MGLRFRQLGAGDGVFAESDAGAVGVQADDVGEWVSSRVRDLGMGGAFVATYRALPVGTALEVEVDLAGPSGPVTMRAEVKWLAEPGRLPAGCDAGMGLAFEQPDVDALLALSDYLAALAGEKAGE